MSPSPSNSSRAYLDRESVRLRVYRQLAEEGRVDSRDDVAAELGASPSEIEAAYESLSEDRHLVLDSDGEIELAHPFGTRDFGFSVKSESVLWWGGCAWDSFAIPHLLKARVPVLVATRCPACNTAHAWNVGDDRTPQGDQVAHFLVPMARVWDNVIHACEHQRIFCDEACVDDWINREGLEKGAVFSLRTLWDLASEWYAGRLVRGYTRREPVAAANYFRSVGLVGPFWGNCD
jgi:Alkylmercury lyase